MLIRVSLILLSLSSMLSLGLKIDRKEIGSWRSSGPLLGFAFLWNFGALPIVAIFLGKLLQLSDLATVAIFLCASSPGGASGGLFVLRGKGNPVLGGLLIATLNGANTVLTPFIFSVYQGGSGFETDLFLRLLTIGFFLQGLPLLIGLVVRYFFPHPARISEVWVEKFSTYCLVFSILVLVIQYGDKALSLGPIVWLAAALTVGTSLLPGWLIWKGKQDTKASLSLVSGIRSLSLALLLAELHVKNPEALLTILMYGVLMYGLTALAAQYWKGRVRY